VQQRDAGGAVGIVLDRRDLRRNRIFAALKVDETVLLARAAALWRVRDVAVVVAPECFFLTSSSDFSGSFLEIPLKSAVVMKRRPALVAYIF